jgi:hypothetical protein
MADETANRISDAGMRLDLAERRLLAGMPLHAITSVHGEAGLRERLATEIAGFPAADRDRAWDVLALASRLHAADRRQNEPYASHLLRVTIRILSHHRVTDPDVACAALLHDAVEDHAADIAPGDRQAARAVRRTHRHASRRGHRPRMGARPRQARTVPQARPRQPGGQPLGAGDQGLGLHRQRRGSSTSPDRNCPSSPASTAPGARAARSSCARTPAGRRRKGPNRRPARHRPGAVRHDRARRLRG